jgi:hypothetical protein
MGARRLRLATPPSGRETIPSNAAANRGDAPIRNTGPVSSARQPSTAPSGGRIAVLIALVTAIAAACGASPATVTQPPGPAPTTTPGAGASTRPTPSPAVTSDPGQAAVAKFVALVTAHSFAYQATFTGESRHTVDVLPISRGLLQVSGQDVLVRATFTFKGNRTVVEHRAVGGRGWVRYGAGAWNRLTGFGAAQSMAAFGAVHGPTDVTYLGPAPGGKAGFLVSLVADIVNPVMIPASNLTEVVVTSAKLALVIDAAGRPVSGTDTIDGHGRVSGQLQEVAIDLTLTFTKVGQKVTITAP